MATKTMVAPTIKVFSYPSRSARMPPIAVAQMLPPPVAVTNTPILSARRRSGAVIASRTRIAAVTRPNPAAVTQRHTMSSTNPVANAVAMRPTLVGAMPSSSVLRVPRRRISVGASGVVNSIATTQTDIGMAIAIEASMPSEGS